MRHYDTETSKEIHNLRLKERIGPKPNANKHIVIVCDQDGEVGFFFAKEKE